jgi:predicted alpha/beta superfamily hydrolase
VALSKVRIGCLLIPAVTAALGSIPGQEHQSRTITVTLGHHETVQSKVLDEERTILVHLPDDYDTSSRRYPVLYILDGEDVDRFKQSIAAITFSSGARRLPKMIVVGIVNSDRTRDLTPRKVAGRESSGGGDAFLEFIVSELDPYLESRFRVAEYRVLFGGSSAGSFAIYALFGRPAAFSAGIASRPVLTSTDDYSWDSDVVFRMARKFAAQSTPSRNVLYIDHGGREDTLHDPMPIQRLAAILESAAGRGFRLEVRAMEESGYRSAESLKGGLLSIFHSWYYPADSLLASGLEGIEDHAHRLSDELGYSVTVADFLDLRSLTMFGDRFLERGDPQRAIGFFEYAVQTYPESWESHEGLGEALVESGDTARAIKHYEISLRLNPENPRAEEMLGKLR